MDVAAVPIRDHVAGHALDPLRPLHRLANFLPHQTAAARRRIGDALGDVGAHQRAQHRADLLVALLVAHRVADGAADQRAEERGGAAFRARRMAHLLRPAPLLRLDALHDLDDGFHIHHLRFLVAGFAERGDGRENQSCQNAALPHGAVSKLGLPASVPPTPE